jgi:hypothetical protein
MPLSVFLLLSIQLAIEPVQSSSRQTSRSFSVAGVLVVAGVLSLAEAFLVALTFGLAGALGVLGVALVVETFVAFVDLVVLDIALVADLGVFLVIFLSDVLTVEILVAFAICIFCLFIMIFKLNQVKYGFYLLISKQN